MNPRRISYWKIAIFLCVLPALFYSTPQFSDTALVKLDKRPGDNFPKGIVRGIKGLEELRQFWIAEMDVEALSTLTRKGIPCHVLDRNPYGKKYFIVSTPEPGQAKLLEKYGGAVPLDDQNCLFWSGADEAREILPAEFEIERLSFENHISLKLESGILQARFSAGGQFPRAPFVNPLLPVLAGQVAKANLSSNILSLQSFQTRYASTENCEAAGTFLYNFFAHLGLHCEYEPFTFATTRTSRNIVATLLGKTHPLRVIIICAHYDSTSNQPTTLAPGADDNASGTAAVMEIARVLANTSFDYTIKFICFSAEEWGLYGSKYYAQAAKGRHEMIIGVVNLDMIAYADLMPEDLNVFVNQTSEWLANRNIIMGKLYGPLDILKALNSSMRSSDHAPFWDQGYSAMLGIEDYGLKNPYYHKTADTFDTLNMDFATSVTKIALTVVADLAQPITWR
ncbi:MAG: Zn-dependent exopeptidase M28 [Candidatus Aminicenantes bacterium]|nr:Zn-dependent exopeptidase M28 [Candidatus Aminicenantes bacterium]